MTRPKLFIPGPTHVHEDVLEAMGQYPIGHRTPEYRDLQAEVVQGLKEVLYTDQHVLISTSSATGLMEAGVRNLSSKRVANFVCGAFSRRQAEITKICGLDQDVYEVPWGQAIKPEFVAEALQKADYDLVTMVFNETSTGVMNPLEDIARVVSEYPDTLLMVDAVSGMAGAPIKVDEWGIDMCLASVQKAWALPPGFALTSLSDRALDRSGTISASQKGFYFDFVRIHRAGEKHQTTITPSIPHLYGLQAQLKRLRQEGLENRFKRHADMAKAVQNWGRETFGLFAEPGYESPTLTCFANQSNLDLIALASKMREKDVLISGGYGDLKGKTFRLAHMGDLTMDDMREVMAQLDDVIKELTS